MLSQWTNRTWLLCGALLVAVPATAQDEPAGAATVEAQPAEAQPAEAQPAEAQPQGLFDRDTLTDG